jgi:hypothetical protein
MIMKKISKVWVGDIANPGFGPIFAVHALADREYVFVDHRVLSDDEDFVAAFAEKVRARGEIDPALWDTATMTDDERVAHYDALHE